MKKTKGALFILVLLIISLSGISSCRSIRDFLIVNTKDEEIPAENMEESSGYGDEEKMETESYDIEEESIKDRESSMGSFLYLCSGLSFGCPCMAQSQTWGTI